MFDAMFPSHWSRIRKLYWLNKLKNNVATYEVVVGNPVTFNAKAAPLRQLKVAFSPVQAGSGDPSPDNVRPISGWDSLTVEQRGKNLFSGEKLENASISASGTLENNNSNDVLIARVFEGETYTFSLNPSGVTVGGLFTDYPTMDSVTYNNARLYLSGSESYTYTIPQGVKYIGIRYLKTFTEYQIVLGYTLPAEYVPYNPSSRSISISLGQTVYSGTVDVISGVVTVTMASVDMGTLDWIYYGNLLRFGTKLADGKPTGGSTPSSNVFCSQYAKFVGGYRLLPDDSITVGSNFYEAALCAVVVHDETYTDAATFKAAVTGQTLCYELATPIPIQLTPQEVSSLLGVNNMWSDANGDLTVEYRKN